MKQFWAWLLGILLFVVPLVRAVTVVVVQTDDTDLQVLESSEDIAPALETARALHLNADQLESFQSA